jgi:glycosyltransferase involved in cell wall biosynthesis
MAKPKVCILFLFEHLAYSPTVLNLYDALSVDFEVEIISIESKIFSRLTDRKVHYLSFKKKTIEKLYYKLFKKWGGKAASAKDYKEFMTLDRVGKIAQKQRYDIFIAVDWEALWVAQQNKIANIHFLSLELTYSIYEERCNKNEIKSVFIQRQDRYDHIFKDIKHQTFLVQNAPTFVPIDIPKREDKNTILFCGTASRGFGAPLALNFVEKYPPYKVHFKGTVYEEIRTQVYTQYSDAHYEGRIILDSEYMAEKDMLDFIKNFRIGLCFYDMRYKEFDNFNYQTAPSGKLFKYLAAGVPVIGSDIAGLSYIKEYQAGILIEKPTAENIYRAIALIEENYDFYVQNALKIAQKFSFAESVQPYINFLKTT